MLFLVWTIFLKNHTLTIKLWSHKRHDIQHWTEQNNNKNKNMIKRKIRTSSMQMKKETKNRNTNGKMSVVKDVFIEFVNVDFMFYGNLIASIKLLNGSKILCRYSSFLLLSFSTKSCSGNINDRCECTLDTWWWCALQSFQWRQKGILLLRRITLFKIIQYLDRVVQQILHFYVWMKAHLYFYSLYIESLKMICSRKTHRVKVNSKILSAIQNNKDEIFILVDIVYICSFSMPSLGSLTPQKKKTHNNKISTDFIVIYAVMSL